MELFRDRASGRSTQTSDMILCWLSRRLPPRVVTQQQMPAEDLQLYVWPLALLPYRKSQLRQNPVRVLAVFLVY